jgi:biotin carboxyl carrier protein
MTFEVDINGRRRTIAIEAVGAAGPGGGRFRVLVDGTPLDLSARPTDLGLSILTGDGRSLDAAITRLSSGESLVQLPRVSVVAAIDRRRAGSGPAPDRPASGEQRITAPMPGRIVRLLVGVGDTVAARQGIVVVEAMKMENEVGAQRAGRVKEIAVAEGASVEAGRLLVVIE